MAQIVYTGSLNIKKKSELRDIAVALHISDKGTRDDLLLRIRKHLEENQQLENDPVFVGLFSKLKRSVQSQSATASRSAPSSASESQGVVVVQQIESPKHTRSTRRFNVPDIVRESTPAPDAREVSMMLKKPPISPEGRALPIEIVPTPANRGTGEVVPSAPRSILRSIPTPSVESAVSSLRGVQADANQAAIQFLFSSRLVLSSTTNIWSISLFTELLYILYIIIPWKTFEVSLLPPQSIWGHSFHLSIRYAPLAILASPTFWTILIHWAIPTIIVPALVGSLVSFNPVNSPTTRAPRPLYFDALTASVTRVAVHYIYPYDALKSQVECVDILGSRWRLLEASVLAALAFAEAIALAPRAYAESKLRRSGTLKRASLGEPFQS
ncbi:hypothetical protein EDD16DRAFT_1788188 [Pisolithus croceorrhizus]|nr:hypothetical protein EDD16DRAFT_1788188 [Pisolithus croceorrhizus]KAI6123111.1 hypothetical protein EV401DRAFT_2164745 [Pisolithus croceorrhizus]KAI6158680.1 hypothetical protein EDD17DRAFT_1844135 [Pisolithus thermaeus]